MARSIRVVSAPLPVAMILSARRQFVFIHIPKTGGTSIAHLYDPHMRWDDIVIGGTGIGEAVFNNVKWRNRFRLVKHSSYGEMRAIVGNDWLAGKFVFLVVCFLFVCFISCCNFLMANVTKKKA